MLAAMPDSAQSCRLHQQQYWPSVQSACVTQGDEGLQQELCQLAAASGLTVSMGCADSRYAHGKGLML